MSHLREAYGKTLKVLGGSRGGEASPSAVLEPVAPEAGVVVDERFNDGCDEMRRYEEMMKLLFFDEISIADNDERLFVMLGISAPRMQYFDYQRQ